MRSEIAARLMGDTSTVYAFLQKRLEANTAGNELLFFDIYTGNKSMREVEEFNVHPNSIKSLRVGECIVLKKYPIAAAEKVQIALP